MYSCAWMHTMARVCSALFKTRFLVVKYPKGVLTEVNGFHLSSFFSHRIRSWNWPGGNLCLCLPYWAGSVMLVPAESLGSWAEAVLGYPGALRLCALFDCILGFMPVLISIQPCTFISSLPSCHITLFNVYCKTWRSQSEQSSSCPCPGSSHVLRKNRASAQQYSAAFSCTSRDLLLKSWS